MSYRNTNYNFPLNNFKDLQQIKPSEYNINLFNRNNKVNMNYQNQNSNRTTNNFSSNFLEPKYILKNKEKITYNTYYSNFQSQGNQNPYKINSSIYNNSNNLDYRKLNSSNIPNEYVSNMQNNILRYNPILNQMSQNSIGVINSTTSYPLILNSNSINNSISNNMTNATSSYPIQNNSIIPSSININKTEFNMNDNGFLSNYNNSQINNRILNNNYNKRNYSSYDYQRDRERRKKEEYSDILKQQIEEKNRRKILEKKKQLEEDLKYEQKYQDYLKNQEIERNLRSQINSNMSYNIKKAIKKSIKKNNNIMNGEEIPSFNESNNGIFIPNNKASKNYNTNSNINNIQNKAININNNNINFFMLERNQNKRPITSSIAETGLGIIGNIKSNQTQIKNSTQINTNKRNQNEKMSFPFIYNKEENLDNNIKNQYKSYSMRKVKDNTKFKKDDYSNIYSIIDKINFKGITYRSKYEKLDDTDKNKNGKIEKSKTNQQIKNLSNLIISKTKENDPNKDEKDEKKEKLIDENKDKKEENNITEKENEMKNKDNNEVDTLINNNIINKDKEINFEDINKCYYKEDNAFLDFDNFSEINKSTTSLKNTEKKEENKELKNDLDALKNNLNEGALIKSIKKNNENYDDICNVRYSDEEDNKNENRNINSKEEKKLNFFEALDNKNEEEDDLVQEKPEADDNNIEENIKIDKSNEESFKNKEEIQEDNLKDEKENNVKESETLRDSYCDLLVKNMQEYRNLKDSKI